MKATIIQENLPLVSNLPNAPNEFEFRSFIRSFLQFPLTASKQDNFALFRIVLSEMLVNAELRTLYYQQILEPTLTMAETHFGAQAAKRGLNPSNASLTIRVISSMVMGLMLMRIMGDPLVTDQWEKLPDLLTDLILNGLKDNES